MVCARIEPLEKRDSARRARDVPARERDQYARRVRSGARGAHDARERDRLSVAHSEPGGAIFKREFSSEIGV
jgi:hypothetical protein